MLYTPLDMNMSLRIPANNLELIFTVAMRGLDAARRMAPFCPAVPLSPSHPPFANNERIGVHG